ncbi:hypothetical protein BVC80_1065g192 [Macleaya cordata]|uniref:Cyclin-dependent kinase inhibitor n=1 Tax=Macleaya cordata TaxID=56857 RepID=A0A200RD81_MACCD|nr:hypothetical protein BVC80_1065g192 [Macleaya cordata]
MGLHRKSQVDGGKESEGKKWVVAGIPLRTPLRPISTNKMEEEDDFEEQGRSTTPTAEEARISERLPCPPAPRKRRPSLKCQRNDAKEFFNPPELESVFMSHFERSNY